MEYLIRVYKSLLMFYSLEMKNFFNGQSKCGGVYRIFCTKSFRSYIGSTAVFTNRFSQHKKDLFNNLHHCKFLQREWNKFEPEDFVFEILETIEIQNPKEAKEKRLQTEQKYIDEILQKFNRDQLYNGYTNVRDIPYLTRHDDYKEKMRVKMVEYYSKPENREKSKQQALKQWSEHSAKITVTNKDTKETVLINGSIRDFCLARNLSYKSFHLMVQGKVKVSDGWFLGTEEPKYHNRRGEKRGPMSKEQKETRADVSREGIVIENFITKETIVLGKNIKDSCSPGKLDYKALRRLLLDETSFTQNGWFKKSLETKVRNEIKGFCGKCNLVFGSSSGMRNHRRRCE